MALNIRSVLITDDVDPACIRILKENGIEVTVSTNFAKDKAGFLAAIPSYDGLIVRSATKVTADIINASKLVIIGRAGTGVDNIDCDAATRKGVVVMNTPGGNTLSAAELTCSMICSLARSLAAACQTMKEGRWDRKLFMGEELYGKTLAVIGLGRIGREVAQRMRSFGMSTIGYDPLVSAEDSAKFGVTFHQLDEIWPVADYITVHVPLIPQTANLVNAAVFGKCKRGVKIINCARGGIIDEDALLEALRTGQCGGAGLDVFLEEPTKNLALVQHPAVVATPHLGASTNEAQARVAEEIAQQFVDAAAGKSLFGVVNADALSSAYSAANEPWIFLGRALGSIGASLLHSQAALCVDVNIKVVADGATGKNLSRFISPAVLAGLLSDASNNGLNLVNAVPLAKERGLKVSIATEQAASSSAAPVITVHLGDAVTVVGTVKGGQPLLVALGLTSSSPSIGGAALSSNANLMIYKSADQALPSVISALSKEGVAVTSYSRLADGPQTPAWGVLQLDRPLTPAVVTALSQLVEFVRSITLPA